MNVSGLIESLTTQFPNGSNKYDNINLTKWISDNGIDVEKMYDVILNNHETRTFPPLRKIKEWHYATREKGVSGANNIFNEIMAIGQAMPIRLIYNKIKLIRKKKNWHPREEIFVGLFGAIWGEWGVLKDHGWLDDRIEKYLENMDAKGKILAGEDVRVPESLFEEKGAEVSYDRQEKLKPIGDLI